VSISGTVVLGADIRFREAAAVLRPFVGCFWVITAERGAKLRLVPDGSTTISVVVRDGQPADWILRGPLERPRERRFTAPSTLVGIRLRPGVAFLLSRISAHSIVDRAVRLAARPTFAPLISADPVPQTPMEHIDALERFLVARLAHETVHPVVGAALAEIERSHGCGPAASVAARCNVSPRHLHRLMLQWVGFGTKRLATIVRLQSTLHQMERAPRSSAAALAAENGYFDQSHLHADAARFTGATPGRLSSRHVADFSKTRCDDLL
jgi:AraC-like DNA-binding protein